MNNNHMTNKGKKDRMIDNNRDRYLDYLCETLIGETYNDEDTMPIWPLRRLIKKLFPNIVIGRKQSKYTNPNRNYWQTHAMTMVGRNRLDNIRHCIETCDREGIDGAFVECGVWRGGASMYAKAVIDSAGSNRLVWLFDSFKGLPKPRLKWDMSFDWTPWNDVLGVSQDEVRNNFSRNLISTDKVCFVEGFFGDTIPKSNKFVGPIAVLRMDGDMYESTRDILEGLYSQVQPGGFVIVDDWSIPAVKQAIHDYFLPWPGMKPVIEELPDREADGSATAAQWRKIGNPKTNKG